MNDPRYLIPDETCEPFFLSTVTTINIGVDALSFTVPNHCFAVIHEIDFQGNQIGVNKARHRVLLHRGNYLQTPVFPFTGFQEFADKKMSGIVLKPFERNTLGIPTQPENLEGYCLNPNNTGFGNNDSARKTPIILEPDRWSFRICSQFSNIAYFSVFGWVFRDDVSR